MPTAGTSQRGGRAIAIECNGARAAIWISTPELIGAVTAHSLPLGWMPTTPADDDRVFGFDADGGYAVSVDGEVVFEAELLDTALSVLRSYIFQHVLESPRGRVFVHAACAAHHGRAILLPGARNTGKTTLVAALVRAGARYYTDDYAPLDADGIVHPYPLPLWMVELETGRGRPHPVESIGGTAGEQPLPVAVVARIVYRGNVGWDVTRRTEGQGTLLVLEHTVGRDHQPEFALGAARRAATGALVLDGERGDPEEAAATLLELAESHAQAGS